MKLKQQKGLLNPLIETRSAEEMEKPDNGLVGGIRPSGCRRRLQAPWGDAMSFCRVPL